MSRRNAIGLGLAALAVIGAGATYFLNQRNDSPGAITQATAADSGEDMGVDPKTDNIMGDPNAPVTIVEYSSLTCPHCASFHQLTVPGLKEKYVETGKVRYVIREFPLDRVAFAAAALTRCAGPDKYFPFTFALYKNQANWAGGDGNPVEKLFNMSKQAGFTEESFNACMQNKEVIDRIEAVRQRGQKDFGVNSTPTLFVNGKKLKGGNSLSDLEKAMEPYLKG